jgi:hypothetical protein
VSGLALGDGTRRYEPGWRRDKLGFPTAYWRIALKDAEPLERLVAFLRRFGVGADIRAFDPGGGRPLMRKVESSAPDCSACVSEHPGRVQAVRFHDLHHVATGYDTSWTGEAEIGAWELASGCAHHAWAWTLSFGAFEYGLWLAPRRVFRAFVRGRHAANLYRSARSDALLAETVGELRVRLGLGRPAPAARLRDALAFAVWVGASALYGTLFAAVVAGVVWLAISTARALVA